MPVAIEKFRTVPMKTALRPIRSAKRPHYGRAKDCADPRRQQNDRRLAKAQLPRHDDEGEDKADQEIVEEFEHIAENSGNHDPQLVFSQ
jgi:hypothetical protein